MEINIEELKKIKINPDELLFIKVPSDIGLVAMEQLVTSLTEAFHHSIHQVIIHPMDLNPVVMSKKDAKKLVEELNKRIV